MKRVLMTAIALALSSGAAYAADPAFVGNTLKVTSADGTMKVWYKADKTFTAEGFKGEKMSGTWVLTGDQFCAMQVTPAPAKHCHKMEGTSHKVGDTWEDVGEDGKKVTLSIVAGS